MQKPISPKVHSMIDYGFASVLMAAPSLLKLRGAARALSYIFSTGVASYSGLTDQPLAVSRKIPFRTHKTIDAGNLAAILLLPAITGVMKQKKARNFFLAMFAAGLTTVLLTDWDGQTEEQALVM